MEMSIPSNTCRAQIAGNQNMGEGTPPGHTAWGWCSIFAPNFAIASTTLLQALGQWKIEKELNSERQGP
jgi:hypothetical protein